MKETEERAKANERVAPIDMSAEEFRAAGHRLVDRIAEETSELLWFLVACNPSAPAELREHLRARLRESAVNP